MPQIPKNTPQTYEDMIAVGMERRSNSKIYKAESMEVSDAKITDIVTMASEELAKLADAGEKLSLFDTQTIKRRTVLYLRSCADTSSMPSFNALCRSFGYSREGVRRFMQEHPNHDTTLWLSITHDSIADAMAEAALRNAVNNITAIFTLKARDGWRDAVTIETPTTQSSITELTAAEIAAKWSELPAD